MRETTNTDGPRLRSDSVREELAARILDGRFPEGTRLPSEPELAEELNVSRTTLREALHSLAAEGLVRRLRGSGTFVLERPRVANSFDLNFGVTEAICAAGMKPGTLDPDYRIEPASAENAERLQVPPGASLLVIDRVRTADTHPVVVSRDVLPHSLLEGHADAVDRMLEASVYDVLRDDLGIVIDYGVAHFQPVQADSALAERLGAESGELLVYLWQVDYTSDATPILLSHEYHLAGAFEFSVVRRGPGRS